MHMHVHMHMNIHMHMHMHIAHCTIHTAHCTLHTNMHMRIHMHMHRPTGMHVVFRLKQSSFVCACYQLIEGRQALLLQIWLGKLALVLPMVLSASRK